MSFVDYKGIDLFKQILFRMNIIKGVLFFSLLLLITSCKDDDKTNIDVSLINLKVEIGRFDQDFHKATPETLGDVKNAYPYLFPRNEPDSIWIARKNDSLAQKLYKEVQTVFGDFETEQSAISDVFKRVTYHYPTFKAPKVVTIVSNLDLDHQVIYADSLFIISLDTYLGNSNPFYANYPEYLRSNFDKSQLPIRVAKKVAQETQPKLPQRVFIDRLVAAGKLYYTLHEFLPETSEALLLNYSEEQLKWAQENEEQIWKYFMEQEYLFSTDKELKQRFLDPAPFSKFYRTSDNQSPGRIGEWLGYQIVKAYMQKYVVPLPELIGTAPEEIFKKSNYKPKR